MQDSKTHSHKNSLSASISSEGSFASLIDHTLLKPDATADQILKICEEAKLYSFAGVCVNSSWVQLVSKQLLGSSVLTISVVGFPLGAMDTRSKAFEAERAVTLGAKEIDMVLSIGSLKSKNYDQTLVDIKEVVKSIGTISVKVIIETGLLSQEEKVTACKISEQAGASFVKTCTGFGPGAASVEDVELMKSSVSSKIKIKASGGIKSVEFAMALISAGANRLGTSSGVALVQGDKIQSGY